MSEQSGRVVRLIELEKLTPFENLIYTDGEWTYTDVSLNDQVYDHSALLCGASPAKRLDDLAGVRFLQELLVPGSTLR